VTKATGVTPAGRRTSLLVRMTNAAREAGVVARRIHLVVAIDRLLARLLVAAPGQWVVKGGYANQLRRPDDARFTEDLDLKIDAAIETAPELLASGFAVDLSDDFSYEVASSPAPLEGPPGGGLRFVVVARLSGTELVRFKVDVSAADAVVGELESYFSDPVPRAARLPAVTVSGLSRQSAPHREAARPDLAAGCREHPGSRPRGPRLVRPPLHVPIGHARDRVHRDLRTPQDAPMATGHRCPARLVDATVRGVASRAGSG
jgi:hypothetical protein